MLYTLLPRLSNGANRIVRDKVGPAHHEFRRFCANSCSPVVENNVSGEKSRCEQELFESMDTFSTLGLQCKTSGNA